MKSTVRMTPRLAVMAGLALLAHAGCDDAPVTESNPQVASRGTSGPQTITFHVPEMSDRLKLL